MQAMAKLHPAEAWVHYQLGLTLAAFQPEAALAHLNQAASLDDSHAEAVKMIEMSVSRARASGDRA